MPKAPYRYGVFDDSCAGSPNGLAPLARSRMTESFVRRGTLERPSRRRNWGLIIGMVVAGSGSGAREGKHGASGFCDLQHLLLAGARRAGDGMRLVFRARADATVLPVGERRESVD